MDDATNAMLTDLEYNASSSSAGSIEVRVALYTYDMAVNTSDPRPSRGTATAAAVANSSAAAVASDGLPYITRKTLPDSWEATAQIHASAATKVMPADATAALAITAWEVEGDSVVATVTLRPGEMVTLVTVMHTSRDAATLASGDPYPPGGHAHLQIVFAASVDRPLFTHRAMVPCVAAPWKQHDPLPLTLAYARALGSAKVAAIRGSSTAWWEGFWAKSSIEIPSQPLLHFWNSAQYVMGASSRPGKVVPSIFVSCRR